MANEEDKKVVTPPAEPVKQKVVLTAEDESDETPVSQKTMEVPIAKMDDLLKRMESLESNLREKDSQIAALTQTVSQTRLQEALAAQGADNRARVSFKKLKNKVVIGWPETIGEDKINQWVFHPNNPTAAAGEILKSRFYFVDGSKSEMLDQIEFTRSNDVVFARVVEDQGEFGVLEFEDKSVWSEPIKIHKKFWNA